MGDADQRRTEAKEKWAERYGSQQVAAASDVGPRIVDREAEAEEARWRLLQRQRWLAHVRESEGQKQAKAEVDRGVRLKQLVSLSNGEAAMEKTAATPKRNPTKEFAEVTMHERACRQAMDEKALKSGKSVLGASSEMLTSAGNTMSLADRITAPSIPYNSAACAYGTPAYPAYGSPLLPPPAVGAFFPPTVSPAVPPVGCPPVGSPVRWQDYDTSGLTKAFPVGPNSPVRWQDYVTDAPSLQ